MLSNTLLSEYKPKRTHFPAVSAGKIEFLDFPFFYTPALAPPLLRRLNFPPHYKEKAWKAAWLVYIRKNLQKITLEFLTPEVI